MHRYSLSPDIDIQMLDDSLIVMALEQNAYYSLNHTARWFFEHISDYSEDEIIHAALQKYEGVSEDTLRADFKELANELVDAGILIVHDDCV